MKLDNEGLSLLLKNIFPITTVLDITHFIAMMFHILAILGG